MLLKRVLKNCKNRGSALIVVLFVSAILLLLCISMVNIANMEILMTEAYINDNEAYYIAEGGLQKALSWLKKNPNYSMWDILHKVQPLGNGGFLLDIKNMGKNILEISSTGMSGKSSKTLKVLVKVNSIHPAYKNVLTVDGDFQGFEKVDITGNVAINGNVDFRGQNKIIRGDVKSTKSIRGSENIKGNFMSRSRWISLPAMDEHVIKQQALDRGTFYETSEDVPFIIKGIVYVNSDFETSKIYGDGIIFVNGNIRLNGGEVKSTTNKILTVISKGDIYFSTRTDLNGIIYSSGRIIGNESITVKGSLLCDEIDNVKEIIAIYDNAIEEKLDYELPGGQGNYINVISWDAVNENF